MARVGYQCLGLALVALAAIGAFLPLLPSTPFLLLATGCFVRSSPSWNARLLRSPLFGPMLRDWQEHRGVRPATKAIALLSMAALGSLTMLSGGLPWIARGILATLMLIGAVVVLRLPNVTRSSPASA